VKSALQRARAGLDDAQPTAGKLVEPTDPKAKALLDLYVAGFQNADVAALEKALRTDAAIEMVGTSLWFSGRVKCLRYLAHVIGSPGDWRMTATTANGQPAAVAYHKGDDGLYHAYGLGMLDATETGVSRILAFGGGAPLAARFGLPAVMRS
jgi:RNA polymerase sigma-70 factor (ECF subfamily)